MIFDTDDGVYDLLAQEDQSEMLMTNSIAGRRSPTSWSSDGRFVSTLNNAKTNSDTSGRSRWVPRRRSNRS